VVGEGVRLAALGVVAGLAVAVAAGRALAGLLYGVGPAHPPTLLAVSAVLLGAAALASWVPARRVARTDPAEVLRAE
jgi:ABC-type antimicrobial peptide transport system permease subunit